MVSTRQMTTTITGPSGSGIVVSATPDDLIFDAVAANSTESTANIATRAVVVGAGNATIHGVGAFSPNRANASTKHQQLINNQTMPHSTQFANSATLSHGGQLSVGNALVTSANTHSKISTRQLLDMPVEILDKIFSYVGYRKVAQMRVVSQQMNMVCSAILNSTFQKLQTQLQNRFTHIKRNMPRRESSRRLHPLSFECDIVETCYMRLSLLQMTFGKHIDRKHICFFAGAILDEVYNTLKVIRVTPHIGRHHIITEELYDLSTMAMEYFKEHLEPSLPAIVNFLDFNYCKPNLKSKYLFDLPSSSTGKSIGGGNSTALSSSMPSPPQSNMVLRKGIRKIKQGMKRYNNQLTVLRNDLRFCKKKSTEQYKQITEMQKLLAEQQKQTLEYAARLNENDKKNEEMSMKISTLLQEANKCKTELQYWRSKSPATPINGNEIPADNDAQRADVTVSTEADSNAQQLAVNEFTDDFGVTAGGGNALLETFPTNTTADALNEAQQVQIQTDLTTLAMAVPPTPDANAALGDVGKCDGIGEVVSRPLAFATHRGADTEPATDAIAHVSGNSVICSVGLPATTVKSNAKRRLETEIAAGGSTSLAGSSSALAIGNSSPSDMKKARRVQNKASRCTTSNVITGSKITRSK